MGLSNEERYAKIAFSINHISELTEKLGTHYTYEKLKKLAVNLWYEFLKEDSNSAFWIFGSEISSDHMPAETLTGVAFSCHTVTKQKTLEDITREACDKDRYFESYTTLRGFCEQDRLLGEKGASLLIYAHTQHIAYALCRYKDEFMERYKGLNILLRTIQGECFDLMKRDKDYAYAWMVHNLCDNIFTMNEDFVNKWWVKHHIPHHIKLEYGRYETVFEAFKKYQFRKLTMQDRVDLTLILVGDRYTNYDHQQKEFLTMVEEYNKDENNKEKLKVKPIEEHFKLAKAAKEEADQKPYQRSCEFTDNYVDHNGEVNNLHDYSPKRKKNERNKRSRNRKKSD